MQPALKFYDPIKVLRAVSERRDVRAMDREYNRLFDLLWKIEETFYLLLFAHDHPMDYKTLYSTALDWWQDELVRIDTEVKPRYFKIDREYFSIFKPCA